LNFAGKRSKRGVDYIFSGMFCNGCEKGYNTVLLVRIEKLGPKIMLR
jgi:hypothetical protein